MLKSRLKIIVLLITIVTLISTFCFATDTTGVTADDLVTTTTGEDTEAVTGNNNVATVDENSWINNDLYEVGDKVEINKVVDGNVFVVAKEVVISSEIGGDAFIVAQKITIDGGYIYSNLFAAAQEIVVNGIVYDVYAVANTFTLGSDGYVYRDLKATANTINLDGKIRRDAYLTGVSFNINAENGNIIGGNLNYTATNQISVPEGAVAGNVNYTAEKVEEVNVSNRVFDYISNLVNQLVLTLAIILLAIWLAPKFVERVSNMTTKSALANLGWGALVPIVSVVAIVLLLISHIAVSVAIPAMFIFISICICGTGVACIYFGNLFMKLVKWEGNLKLAISSVIVSLAIWVVGFIPYLGWLITLLVSLFGIGTLVVNVIKKDVEA